MKIRDGLATINGDKTETEMLSGCLEVIADDGRPLFALTLQKDGSVRIHAGTVCRHNGKMLDDKLVIKPVVANAVEISRPDYQV